MRYAIYHKIHESELLKMVRCKALQNISKKSLHKSEEHNQEKHEEFLHMRYTIYHKIYKSELQKMVRFKALQIIRDKNMCIKVRYIIRRCGRNFSIGGKDFTIKIMKVS